jgi:hypothetical protein
MRRYIGLDVHAASTTFAVVSEAGNRLGSHVVETHGQALVAQLKTIPGEKARVPRRGYTERVDLRDPFAARGGGRRGVGLGEPRPEERRARRVRPCGPIAHWRHQGQGIQGGWRVQDAPRAGSHAPDGGAGHGAGPEPNQGAVPVARWLRRRTSCSPPAPSVHVLDAAARRARSLDGVRGSKTTFGSTPRTARSSSKAPCRASLRTSASGESTCIRHAHTGDRDAEPGRSTPSEPGCTSSAGTAAGGGRSAREGSSCSGHPG